MIKYLFFIAGVMGSSLLSAQKTIDKHNYTKHTYGFANFSFSTPTTTTFSEKISIATILFSRAAVLLSVGSIIQELIDLSKNFKTSKNLKNLLKKKTKLTLEDKEKLAQADEETINCLGTTVEKMLYAAILTILNYTAERQCDPQQSLLPPSCSL